MVHFPIKDLKYSRIAELGGEVVRKVPRGAASVAFDMQAPPPHYEEHHACSENPEMMHMIQHHIGADIKESFIDCRTPPPSESSEEPESDKINDYKIRLGDVIKFGRISYKVSELYLP